MINKDKKGFKIIILLLLSMFLTCFLSITVVIMFAFGGRSNDYPIINALNSQ